MNVTLDPQRQIVTLSGRYALQEGIPSEEEFFDRLPELQGEVVEELCINLSGLEGDREGMLIACQRLRKFYGEKAVQIRWESIPEEIRALWTLILEKKLSSKTKSQKSSFWQRFSERLYEEVNDLLLFTGELVQEISRLATGKSRLRVGYFLQKFRECSVDALPISSLIGMLVGLILAYISAVQLVKFGASIYVANLVSVAIAREMGPVMIAIIIAGRTGAAYAAEIGSMKVSEEVDAMRSLGISPMEYLVLPRLLALTLSMPMLSLYGSVLGVLSGAFIANTAFEINYATYFNQVKQAVSLSSMFSGLFKSMVFGAVVAFAGSWRGMQCGFSSAEVGRVTTSAVVTSITWIIVLDALFAVLFNLYGI